MRRICLTLPTNRECSATIRLLAEEAAYAADRFGVEVHLLVLDSCPPAVHAAHAATVHGLEPRPGVVIHHLDEAAQREFLLRVIDRARSPKAEWLLDLLLPSRLSYGACTDRAFLVGRALGCASVHRRDSDSRYQEKDGSTVFPIHHELLSLGATASEAARHVDVCELTAAEMRRPVAMVGASFTGEPSVDLAEIAALDPRAYDDLVSLWAPLDAPEASKRDLVAQSFLGAGRHAFDGDHSVLTRVDPMRVDMCNIAFHGVHEQVPLPPATDTIGSDYFLIHLVHHAGLPGVLHNRDIVNYYTGERRTAAGFVAYQTRFVKFLLSMLRFHYVYAELKAAGPGLLRPDGTVDADRVARIVRRSTSLEQSDNVTRLDRTDAVYRGLGGRYADLADHLRPLRESLLDEARADFTDYALLIESWGDLMESAGAVGLAAAGGPAGAS
ncbi:MULTISPECIES: DUF6271 family protein [unclassified Streptomyces]|uniref:DUF6271 family protein n=1 Tax=unclassified Streptomyces TaxID=2593676 RepID=UPI000DADF012|nr:MULTISPECIES: DUF6271 family protein [unclassified Streptomyces]PZT71777.1 hypothetical protein DNK55_32125 [Streptomyces sp. AC1-42T]PZT73098.1 hypothetical protein DNK56_32950 [Streptomyces sp. AC1-42W]